MAFNRMPSPKSELELRTEPEYYIKYMHPDKGAQDGTFHTNNLKHVLLVLKDGHIRVDYLRRESDGAVLYNRNK